MAQLFTLRSKKRKPTPGEITGPAITATTESSSSHRDAVHDYWPAYEQRRRPTSLAAKRKIAACGEKQRPTLYEDGVSFYRVPFPLPTRISTASHYRNQTVYSHNTCTESFFGTSRFHVYNYAAFGTQSLADPCLQTH